MSKQGDASISRLVSKLPMNMAAAKLVKMGVETSYDFKLLTLREGRFEKVSRPYDVPGNPATFYENFTSWEHFIQAGRDYLDSGKEVPEIPSYEEMKKILKEHKVDTRQKFKQLLKNKHIVPSAPKAPERYYADSWEGWDEFLAPNSRFLPYEEAKKIVREFRLLSSAHWRELCRRGARPEGIPSLPHRDYPEFEGWPEFLGYEKPRYTRRKQK